MNIYSIYKATNKINGKVYIGFDSNWPKRRNEHESESFNKNITQYNYAFHKAIRKYGKDGFDWEIIFESYDKEYTLKVMEPFFIAAYDSLKKGYNMTEGGNGGPGYKHTPESLKKMSESQRGNIQSEETKRKRSESMKGVKKSKEHIENMVKGKKKWYKTEEGQKDIQKRRQRLLNKPINTNKGKRTRINLVCVICSKDYYVIPARAKISKCCSRICSAKHANNVKNGYSYPPGSPRGFSSLSLI